MWTTHERRGQITVILILVILLLIIFSVMFFIQRTTQEKKSEQQRKAITLSQEKLDPLKEFVTSCLDISAKAALKDMGRQGGYLYQTQGGPMKDFDETEFGTKYLTYDEKPVAYAIFPPKGSIGPWKSEPPEYPWVTFPEIHNTANVTNESLVNGSVVKGYFGRNKMPNLEKPFTMSMQFQLEEYIAKNAADCLNLENFQTQSLAINKGKPNVTVTLTVNEVVFDLVYPLTVVENMTGATGNIERFAVRHSVRLKKIIDFMERSSNLDVTDAGYNMSNVSGVISSWVERDVLGDDDVVFIRDKDSRIIGEPYTFIYARKNRAPALGLINSVENRKKFDIDEFVLCGLFAGGRMRGPHIRIEGGTLVLENQASECKHPTARIPLHSWDPDEDDVRYVVEVNREETTDYELTEREMGPIFTFAIKAKDATLEDSETFTMKTEVISP